MAMAAATYKQGIILERFWTAVLLRYSKRSRGAIKLTKKTNGPNFRRGKVPSDFFRENGLSSGYCAFGERKEAEAGAREEAREEGALALKRCTVLAYLTFNY